MEAALLALAGLMGAMGIVLAAASAHGALFAGDVAARAFIGARLFPMAAPAGGMILIASWLGVALAALTAR